MRCRKLRPAMLRTPATSSLIGRVMVMALEAAPKITIAQMETNTAVVTSRVRLDDATAAGLGLMPMARTP